MKQFHEEYPEMYEKVVEEIRNNLDKYKENTGA